MGLYDFYIRYINLNLKDYPSIGIDLEINKILLVIMVGIIIGTVVINRKRSLMTLTVNKLLRREAVGVDNAKTLSALGIDTKAVRRMLTGGGQIKTVVKTVGEETLTYEEYLKRSKEKGYKGETVDYSKAGIYLIPESLDTAKRLAASRSHTPLNTLLFCILIFAVFVCLVLLMPEILSVIDTLLVNGQ